MNKAVVITGASSGIGLAAAKIFRAEGDRVYNLSRTGADIFCDVTDEESVKKAFAQIEKIDVLVLNAGFGISGAIESTSQKQAQKQFDVNFFGAVRCVRCAAPLLRESKGTIIFVSSLAAALPIPFQAFYSASKAAVGSLARSLAAEMKPFGVKVCAILPGDIKTGFTDKRQKNDDEGLYLASAAKAVGVMESDERKGMPPEKIAKLIHKISKKKRPRPQYTKGFGYKVVLLLTKILPAGMIDWIVGKKYGIGG